MSAGRRVCKEALFERSRSDALRRKSRAHAAQPCYCIEREHLACNVALKRPLCARAAWTCSSGQPQFKFFGTDPSSAAFAASTQRLRALPLLSDTVDISVLLHFKKFS